MATTASEINLWRTRFNNANERIRQLRKQCEVLSAEAERMRPVVEAAVLWGNTNYRNEEADAMLNALSDACDEYQASNPK